VTTTRARKTLCLALGIDILGDDGVAFAAADMLKERFGDSIDFICSSEVGLAVLELIDGYERALLLDSVMTGTVPPGTVLTFAADDFRSVMAPSPHEAGLPEVFTLADRLTVPIPADLLVLAMEIDDPYVIREGLSPAVENALPEFVQTAAGILQEWLRPDAARMPAPARRPRSTAAN